jgi:hypothetical protein
MQSRLKGNSWDMAIALYHSASPLLGAQYLRQVRAAWPWTRTGGMLEQAAYAVVLSPAARQVQVIHVSESLSSSDNLPRVLGPQSSAMPVQWSAMPQAGLPVVLTPRGEGGHGAKRTRPVPGRRSG